jgi:hypothetical protein
MAREDLERFFLQQNLPYVKPFYSIDYENDTDVLDWIKSTDTTLSNYYQPLFREQKNNLKIFLSTGINPNFFSPMVAVYLNQGLIYDDPDEIYINELYLLVMEQVATIVSNELTAQVLPNNDDYKDKVAAKFVKMWLDSISYDLSIDTQRIKWEIQKKIFGEAFVIPIWNPDKGDIHPIAKDLEEDEIDLLDDDGRKVKDENGDVVKISKYQRIGEIDLINPLPFDVMIDPKQKYENSDWFYYVEYKETSYLQRKYKDLDFGGDSQKISRFDPMSGLDKSADNYTRVYHFYHRSHPFLNEGRFIVCTDNYVLVNESLKDHPTLIDWQQLPLVRFSDLDVGFGVRGTPILPRNTRNVISGYNRLTNQIYNNLEAESPKIFVHETAGVDAQRMPDGIIIVEWRGGIKPTIETPVTNTSSIFKFREDLKKNIIELGGQTPMVRGDTPNAQLDSFIALQHFEDQRVQLAAPDIKGHIKSMELLYRLIMLIAQDHYDSEDQRLIKIVGRNNTFNLKYFDPENLGKVYDVKITTTGNLANSKAARTQLIMTIKREFPEMMSNEVFVDMLGLSSSDKFQNSITTAVNSAEAENEDMLNGIPVEPPERFEDLITHWDIHRIPLQGREYKLAPPEIKELFERHVTATEKLMFDQAAESPVFASRLQGLRQFPVFFSPVPNNDTPMEEEEAVQDAEPMPDNVTRQEIDVEREEDLPPQEPPENEDVQ